ALRHRVRIAEPATDDVARLAHRDARERRRIGPHVGDQADVAVRRVDTLVEPLCDRHRPLRAEAELPTRLLLEGRGRERWRRAAALLPCTDLGDARPEIAEGGGMAFGRLAVRDVEGRPVDPD